MTKELKADISLFLVTIAWGASFPVMSIAIKSIPPYSFLMMRFLLASAILAAVFHKRIKYINKPTIIGGVIIGLTMFFGTALQTEGLLYTTPSKSGFITGLYVIIVPIFMTVIYKKFSGLNIILGAVLSVTGLAVISLNNASALNFGDALTLISAIVFALQILAVDKFSLNADPIMITLVETLVTGSLSVIPAAAVENFKITINMTAIGAVLFTAVFATVVAYAVQNKMQHFTDPSHAAVIYLAEPVFCAVFSVLLGDHLTVKVLAGCMLIFIGTVITSVKDIIVERTMDTEIKNEV